MSRVIGNPPVPSARRVSLENDEPGQNPTMLGDPEVDMLVVDLFAGPGGWDQGARALGIRTLGVEFDRWACATARAAGHKRVAEDVALLTPSGIVRVWGPVAGLIASPPCPSFSQAGKGAGRADADVIEAAVNAAAEGPDVLGHLEAEIARLRGVVDASALLVLEPLRWVLATGAAWTAWEQVPPVLGLWRACARVLAAAGYSVDVAILSAEQYGVPQTRKRAFLVARSPEATRLHGPAALPAPTHSRFNAAQPHTMEPGVLPWVSMASALGWEDGELVGFPRRDDGRPDGSVVVDMAAYRKRDLREATTPAQTVTEKARSWVRFAGAGPGADERVGQRPRELDEPAHTITGARSAYWITERIAGTTQGVDPDWPTKRPSTTIAGRGLVTHPGGTISRTHRTSVKTRNDGLRVSAAEAGVLQGFPADYPWRGSRTDQYQQIGNAVPPPLARAVIAAVSC